MLTTKQLLSFTPKDAIAAMLNDINPGLGVSGRDLLVSNLQAAGDTLTQVTLTMRQPVSSLDWVPFQGSVNFAYNRLDIAPFATLAFVDFNPTLPNTTLCLLQRLELLFGFHFDPKDFVLEGITSANNGQVTLQAQPGSLRWVGSAQINFGSIAILYINGTPTPATANIPYSFQFVGTGGVPPYTWSAQGLPSGWSMNPATGVVSGTTSYVGSSNVTITLVDSAGTQTQVEVTFQIAASSSVYGLLGVDTTFASSTIGVPYTNSVTIENGRAPYSNPQVYQGTLPPGMSLSINGNQLTMSGTPTAAFFGLTGISFQSADNQTCTQLMQLVTLPPLGIVGSYMNAESGKPFVDGLALTGGSGDYFVLEYPDEMDLPPGIDTVVVNNGYLEIRGNPTTPGTYPFQITVHTLYNQQMTFNLSLTVVQGVLNGNDPATLPTDYPI
jgi:hypothetical protein